MVAVATFEQAPVWRPHSGQQEAFLSDPADEALFGGAAGPGKTECLLMEALRQVGHPLYRAILFRRSFPQLEAADGLIDRSLRWYPGLGGEYNGAKHFWTFPSGARIYFGHMQYEASKLLYQGSQFAFIAFDELTEFLKSQYLYMFSRNRAKRGSGLRVYMRGATNPGNVGHAWVKKRFIVRDIVNRMRYFARVDEEDVEVEADHDDAKSRVFYPARMSDNPSLDEVYIRNINLNPDAVERARLSEGDWDAEHTEGRIYQNWSSLENVTTDAEYNPDRSLWWACDDGYVYGDGPGYANYHPRVILFMQDNELGGVNIFDEYVVCEETHEQSINAALGMDYARPSLAWVDGSAAMFRGELSRMSIPNANGTHPVSEGIKNVRRFVMDGNGVRLLKVHPRCTNVIFEMSEYRADPNKSKAGELVPLKVSDHAQDTLRYGLWQKRTR